MSEVSYKSFENALEALRKAIVLFEEHRGGEFYVSMRNSLILEFEISFGLCRGIMERCMVDYDDEDPLKVQEMSYAEIVRTANEYGYVRVMWEEWFQFREARNRTAHAYSEPMAEKISLMVPAFYAEARYLCDKIKARSAER